MTNPNYLSNMRKIIRDNLIDKIIFMCYNKILYY